MEKYSEYKDSGCVFVTKHPSHWNFIRTKQVITANDGGVWGEEPDGEGDTIVLRSTEQTIDGNLILISPAYRKLSIKEKAKSLLKEGDLIITKSSGSKTHIGKTSIIPRYIEELECCYSNFLQRVRVCGSAKFYWYLFNSHIVKLQFDYLSTTTTGLNNLNARIIESILFALPPLSEQEAIVSFLDEKTGKIDKLISNKEREISLLQEMKQRIIADAVTKGLNPDVRFKSTGITWLPEVPEHWEVRRLSSKFVGDVAVNKDFKYKQAFKFFYGTLVPKDEQCNPEEYKDIYVKYSIIHNGDIIVNGLNLNYDFISQRVASTPYNGIITSAYVVCRPRDGVYSNFYSWLFKAMDYMKLFHGMGSGIRLTLSFKELKKQLLPVPPLSEQQAIVAHIEDKVSKIDTLTQKLRKEIDCAKEYKQRLISDAVTGQIKVC